MSRAALAVLDRLPVIGAADQGPVFTLDGVKPIAGFGKWKAAFDTECGVTGWTVHDLRRTARSLISRARIDPDIAERCLGHVIGGIRENYDCHEYLTEKREAFDALAHEIGRIISGSIGPAPYRALGQIIIVTWAHSPVAVNDNPAAEDHEEFRPRAG